MLADNFDGRDTMDKKKMGRNDLCHCGSGKRYKHCHYDQDLSRNNDVLSPTHKRLLGLNDIEPDGRP